MTSLKFKLENYWSSWDFTSMIHKSSWKLLFQCSWAPREINSRFCSKTPWQMFLLVSDRYRIVAHPDGYQHGVSIQISVNFGKTFLRRSCLRKIAVTWFLAYLLSSFSQILDFIYRMVLIFVAIYFEWRDTKDEQYTPWVILLFVPLMTSPI